MIESVGAESLTGQFTSLRTMPTIHPDFSESSFAFAFVDNLIHDGLLDESSAPRFLSTYAEGKGGHWDVHLPARPVAFFLQFKIPQVMQRGCLLTTGKRLRNPFYRMNLRHEKGYAQHHGLLALEQKGENVYYACPRFHTSEDIEKLFSRKEVPNYTAWFRPSAACPPDYNQRHGIVYDVKGADWEIRSSHPIPGKEPCDHRHFVEEWSKSVDSAKPQRAIDFIERIRSELSEAIMAAEFAESRWKLRRPAEEPETRVWTEIWAASDSPINRLEKGQRDPIIDLVNQARGALGLEILIGGK